MDFTNLPRSIVLTEVGPRDGFQSLPMFIPTAKKIEIIRRIIQSGINHIQITSFVNPKVIPQFKDAEDVISYFSKNHDLFLTGLVLNKKGLKRAISSGIMGVEISIS